MRPTPHRSTCFILAILGLFSCWALAQDQAAVAPSPYQTQGDRHMGDYEGLWTLGPDSGQPLCAHVVSVEPGKYELVLRPNFTDPPPVDARLEGHPEGPSKVLFSGIDPLDPALRISAVLQDGIIEATVSPDYGGFRLERARRVSPTMGAKPPEGALVLFDGTNLDAWEHVPGAGAARPCRWLLLEGGVMEVRDGGIITRKHFTDCKLHVEFRLPFMPGRREQQRANSGVYLQGRYEVQILDTFGMPALINGCGSVYNVAPPRVNMCMAPLEWQTYDITFRAPRFDPDGKMIVAPRLTVVHNGVTIHENQPVPGPTRASLDANVTIPGGLHLQDHGNPVQFRNIWLVETAD